VCGGVGCEAWHDSVDLAWATDYADGNQPAEVMTSWHTDESAAEVVWFFLMNTNFDHYAFTRFLILVIGDDDGISATLLANVANIVIGKSFLNPRLG
jgi:hypothetical protein